jgi:hypothetical protein
MGQREAFPIALGEPFVRHVPRQSGLKERDGMVGIQKPLKCRVPQSPVLRVGSLD